MGRTMIAVLVATVMLTGCDELRSDAGPLASADACAKRLAESSRSFDGLSVRGTFVYSAKTGAAFRSLLPDDPAAAGVTGSAVFGNGEAARRSFLAEPAGDAPEILHVDPRALVKLGFGPATAEEVIAAGCGRIAESIVLEHARLDRVEADSPQDKAS